MTTPVGGLAMLCTGGVLALLGLGLILTYVWTAIVVPWGEPDQSLLFWYLAFPLLGAASLRAGIPLIIRGHQKWKATENQNRRI